MIFDPLGFACPLTLLGKICLRETCSYKLGWDDQLPTELSAKWVRFFYSLSDREYLSLDRCLRPPNSIGQPWLLIFTNGSDLAYGFVAYIRWQLDNSDYWCRLVLAKCRIAPVNKLSTPKDGIECCSVVQTRRKCH